MGTDKQALVLDYCENKNPDMREDILVVYKPLIEHIARKFSYNKSDVDDLIQVASIGLLRSLDRFDPTMNVDFSTFVTPNIIGEIKHYFRDKNRLVKTPRKLQELCSKIRTYVQAAQNEGRSPRVSELAAEFDETEERILEAMEVGQSSMVMSLDAPSYRGDSSGSESSATLMDNLGVDGVEDLLLDKETLKQAIEQLSDRDREIITLRFYSGLSQMEIAERVGLSQMHVSRILMKSLGTLKRLLLESQ